MRSRVTDLKMNFKRKYKDFKCIACNEEEETQKHVLECTEIKKKQPNLKLDLKYEKLFNGNLNDKIQIARNFKENMAVREKFKK